MEKPPWESGILNLSQENHLNKEVLMKNCYKKLAKGEAIFVGIDLHKKTWHVTIRTTDVEFSTAIFLVAGMLSNFS